MSDKPKLNLTQEYVDMICSMGVKLYKATLHSHANPSEFARMGNVQVGDYVIETMMDMLVRRKTKGHSATNTWGKVLEIGVIGEYDNPNYLLEHCNGDTTWWTNCGLIVIWPVEDQP